MPDPSTSLTRRTFVAAALASGAAVAVGRPADASPAESPDRERADHPDVAPLTIVLVHGAFADGSSWSPVLEILQKEHPFPAVAVQLSLRTLADDAAVLRGRLLRIPGPKIVVAHSYGGAVISEADYSGTDVRGLVYLAAYAPAIGESLLGLNATFLPLPAADPQNTLVDLDNAELIMSPSAFVRYFCPDIPRRRATVLAAVQRPIGFGAGGAPLTRAAWTELPTWYQVSSNDQIVQPDLQRMLAERMPNLRERIELAVSHASLISRPNDVARFIARAARSSL